MDKNGNITISYDLWKGGIKTPFTGMADIENVDIFDEPGIAKIDFAPTEVIGEGDVTAGDTDAIQCCAIRKTNGDAVFGTDEGDVLVMDANNNTVNEEAGTTAGNFRDAVDWKGWTVFADFTSNLPRIRLSAYQNGSGGDDITYAFESMPNSSLSFGGGGYRIADGVLCVGIDDVLYVGSGKYVGSLTEDTTFDPTNNATYTWNPQALDLPDGFNIDKMVNFNDFLLIFAGNKETNEQMIVPWDRVSSSYDYPTTLNNGVVAQAIASENLAYYLDGIRGQFRVTNRAVVDTVVEMKNITFPSQSEGLAQKGAAITKINDIILNGVSNSAAGTYPVGVYKIKGNSYTRQTLTEGLDGSEHEVNIHFIAPFKESNYLVGWENVTNNTYGVDEFGLNDYRYTDYKARLISPLFSPGLVLNDKSYQNCEITLAQPLTVGQGVKVYYRKDLADDWTEITTQDGARFDYATYGAVSKCNIKSGIIDVTTIQLKVEMTTGANSTTTPKLISVKLF